MGYLGELEHMILAAALRLGGDAYGAAIIREIRREAGRSVPSGTLSITLDRLERKGLIETSAGTGGGMRGGRPRRTVSITPEGVAALREARRALRNLWAGLEPRLGQ